MMRTQGETHCIAKIQICCQNNSLVSLGEMKDLIIGSPAQAFIPNIFHPMP